MNRSNYFINFSSSGLFKSLMKAGKHEVAGSMKAGQRGYCKFYCSFV